MSGARLYWALVFTDDSLEHLAERGIDADDVAEAVFGRHGPVRVRHVGRRKNERWYVVAPLAEGQHSAASCVRPSPAILKPREPS